MVWFVFGILIVLLSVALGIFVRRIAYVGVALGVMLAFLSFLCQVPAQNVGIITQFGKVTGRELPPGLHTKAPWQTEVDMDGTMQSLDNQGDGRSVVRLKSNYIMFVENNLRWKIRPSSAPGLYQNWRKGSDEEIVETHIAPGLVHYEVAAALNTALADYDPLNPSAEGQTNDQLSARVIDELNRSIGNDIEVVSFVIVRIDFDDATQQRISQVLQAQADTRTAEQKEKTAAAEARANKTLSESIKNDPNVLISKCLDIVAKGVQLPAGFTCFGNSATPVLPVTGR